MAANDQEFARLIIKTFIQKQNQINSRFYEINIHLKISPKILLKISNLF